MRFLLLARARSDGRVRLLSDRAFDSRAAAVDAAAVTAAGLDLADDEVWAIDLESADPVLVLRLGPYTPPVTVDDAFVPDEPPRADADLPAPPSPGLPRARFPLFGPADEEASAEPPRLADELSRVARLMEADLAEWAPEEPDRSDEDWDARTIDDYSLPDDGELSATREEGLGRAYAAEAFRFGDCDALRDDVPVSDNDPFTDAWVEAPAESAEPVGETPGGAEPAPAPWWEADVPEPAEAGSGLDADRVESPIVDWEPSTTFYRPANTDFAVWVCADCVYQRTCRKAGTSSPSSCGNFLWRSS